MVTLNETPQFIFDTNFFICLKDAKAIRPYYHLSLAVEKTKINAHVTGQIFNECPFIVGEDFREFTKGIKIEMVTDSELDSIKEGLAKKGVQLMAQDPDLTLIALAKRLKKEYKADVS